LIQVVPQPGPEEHRALLAIEYFEISSEMMRPDRALAGEMRRHDARNDPGPFRELALTPASQIRAGTFNYPPFPIQGANERRVRVQWINHLVDRNGAYLPHLLPIDQTLHWANPPGGISGR